MFILVSDSSDTLEGSLEDMVEEPSAHYETSQILCSGSVEGMMLHHCRREEVLLEGHFQLDKWLVNSLLAAVRL